MNSTVWGTTCFPGALLLYVALSLLRAVDASAQPAPPSALALELAANYRLPDGGVIGLNAFAGDGPSPAPFFTDYRTGEIRTLFARPDGGLVMGPSLGVPSPVERVVRIIRNGTGGIAAIGLQRPGEGEVVAQRLPADVRDVTFASGDATLTGTLLLPPTKGPIPRSCSCMAPGH